MVNGGTMIASLYTHLVQNDKEYPEPGCLETWGEGTEGVGADVGWEMEETWVSLLVLPLLVLEILVEAHVWCSTETEQPKNEGKHSSCLTELYVVIQHLWKNQGHLL